MAFSFLFRPFLCFQVLRVRFFYVFGVFCPFHSNVREGARFRSRLVSRARHARKLPALKMDGTAPSRLPDDPRRLPCERAIGRASDERSCMFKGIYLCLYVFLVTRKGVFCFTQAPKQQKQLQQKRRRASAEMSNCPSHVGKRKRSLNICAGVAQNDFP